MREKIYYPAPLRPGDKIAIVSPASVVKEEYVEGAMAEMSGKGYQPVLMPHALGHEDGNFAASKSERLSDLFEALENEEIKAILCSRGGYGCTHLLSSLPISLVKNNPKWLIGFSDVSALHALWLRAGVASIHGPMAKHLATKGDEDICSLSLFEILENGGRFEYEFESHKFNQPGKARGILRGGNLAVLNDLANTEFDLLDIDKDEDVILFLEDINEPIYKVNRILWRLLHTGDLERVKGLIFGQFTDYGPDKNYKEMESMIHDLIKNSIPTLQCPVAYNFPIGHTDLNYPLTQGAKVELEVTPAKTTLETLF